MGACPGDAGRFTSVAIIVHSLSFAAFCRSFGAPLPPTHRGHAAPPSN
jgi:hypothetical protein